MKKLIVPFILILALVGSTETNAQVRLNVNVNIGNQPVWGPVGYDYVEYYYLPDIDVWYNVPNRQYIYLDGGRWIFAASLPGRYRGFDLYGSYKVVVNDPRPYLRADVYRVKYKEYKGWKGPRQVIIRDSRDVRYVQRHDNGNHNGQGRGKKKGHRD